MIKFRSNKDNPDYLIWHIRFDGAQLIMGEILPTYVQNELEQMYFDSFEYQNEINRRIIGRELVNEISFRRDSLLGKWLIHNYDQKKIVYEDEFIDYKKVQNALNIAIFECSPIAERIIPLFRQKINGSKEELIKEYDEDVLGYILTHDDFESWISNEEKEAEEYVVFEDGEYSKKVLSTGKKVLEKKNNTKAQ